MAEILGTVVGIVGFAGQCAGGIQKLQEIIKDYKDAPTEIAELVQELEEIKATALNIGQLVQKSSVVAPTVDPAVPLRRCLRALEIASGTVTHIGRDIRARPRTGSIRAAWRKNTINEYRTRIDSAQLSLATAFNAYAIEVQRHEFAQLRSTVTQATAAIDQNLVNFSSSINGRFDGFEVTLGGHLDGLQTTLVSQLSTLNIPRKFSTLQERRSLAPSYFDSTVLDDRPAPVHDDRRDNTVRHRKPRYRAKAYRLQFRLPQWLLGRCFDLDIQRTNLGWILNPRRVVPWDSEFFEACRKANLPRVRSLLKEGKASVFDVHPQGASALDIAVGSFGVSRQRGHVHVINYLLDHGAVASSIDDNGISSAAALLCVSDSTMNDHTSELFNALVHRVFNDPTINISVDNIQSVVRQSNYLPSESFSSIWRSHVEWSTVPVLKRIEILQVEYLMNLDPWTIIKYVEPDQWTPLLRSCNPESFRALIRIMTQSYGEAVLLSTAGLDNTFQIQLEAWRHIFRPIIQQVSDGDWASKHPHCSLLHGFVRTWYSDPHYVQREDRWLATAATAFAEEMAILGANLDAIGEHERRSHVNDIDGSTAMYKNWSYEIDQEIMVRVISFRYGPRPKDWSLRLSDPFSDAQAELFEDFWELVGHPEKTIPGAWVKDVDEGFLSPDDLFGSYYDLKQQDKEARRWEWNHR